MSFPPRSFLSLDGIARRWAVAPFDVIGWSAERLLALSILLPPVRMEAAETFSGLADIEAAHLLPLFRQDAPPGAAVRIHWIRTADGLQKIAEPAEGVAISAPDVLVRHNEIARFEKKHGLKVARRPGGPGAPPRYDWDSFYGALARRVHDRGIPRTQSELVRDMLDWFDRKGENPTPDERTVKRKVAAVWRELSQMQLEDDHNSAAFG